MDKKQLRIGFDMDGVICQFLPDCLEAAKKHNLVPVEIEMKDLKEDLRVQFNWPENAFDLILTADFYSKLPPYMDVIHDIRKWLMDGHYIVYITARPRKFNRICVDWLKQHGIYERSQGCIHEVSALKYKVAKEHELQFFIDDYAKVIKNMMGKIEYPLLKKSEINENIQDDTIHKYEWTDIRNKVNDLCLIV